MAIEHHGEESSTEFDAAFNDAESKDLTFKDSYGFFDNIPKTEWREEGSALPDIEIT